MSKIAFLTPYLPFPADTGGKIRTFNIIKGLAKHHEVHVLVVHGAPGPDAIEEIEKLGTTVRYFPVHKAYSRFRRLRQALSLIPHHVDVFNSPAALAQVDDYISENDFDLVFADEIVMVPYTTSVNGLGLPKVLALQNIDYQLRLEIASREPFGLDKFKALYEYFRLKHYSKKVFRQNWDSVVVCSPADKEVVQSVNPETDIAVVPNGVDLDYFQAQPESPPQDITSTLLFVGSMFYYPNIDAVLHFFTNIFPRVRLMLPSVRVLIVGHNPPPEIQQLEGLFPEVTVTGSVPDVRPYFTRSTMVIVPLRSGGGTSLKIVQGLAIERPVVSTSKGVRGLQLEAGHDLIVADDPSTFADEIVKLAQSSKRQRELVLKGKQAARRFDWRDLADQVRVVCETTIERHPVQDLRSAGAFKHPSPKTRLQRPSDLLPLRILCISNLYPPYVLGGYELLASKTMEALRKRGHEVYVATGRGREFTGDDHIKDVYDLDLDRKEDEFLYHAKSGIEQFKKQLFHQGNYRSTRKLIEEFKPDIVSVWNLYLMSAAPLVAASRTNTKTAVHLTDRWLLFQTKDILAQRDHVRGWTRLALKAIRSTLQPMLYRLANPSNLIVPSNSLRETYLEAGFSKGAFHLIPHGIELELFPYIERKRNNVVRLLYVGQLWEGKGVQVLLRALGRLRQMNQTSFTLSIYGSGVPHFIDYLKGIANEEGLQDYIQFCGTVSYADLASVYHTHDVLIFPSVWNEPFALVPLEAMSTGLPIVASDAGGTKEAVRHEQTGLVVPANDVQSMADAIGRLLKDDALRKQLGHQAATVAREEYGFEKMVDDVENFYFSLREAD